MPAKWVTSSTARSSMGISSPECVLKSTVLVGAGDVEGNPVLFRQHGQSVGAYLVGDVSVGCDPVGPNHHAVDITLSHKTARRRNRTMRVDGIPSCTSSHAVRREPWRKGTGSSVLKTWKRLPASQGRSDHTESRGRIRPLPGRQHCSGVSTPPTVWQEGPLPNCPRRLLAPSSS